MKSWGVSVVLLVALAAFGCGPANGGEIGDGGSGGIGGEGGSAGEGGMGGMAGAGGMGGMAGAGGMGGMAGAGGMGGMAGAGGMGGMAGAGGMGGMAGAGGMGGMAGAGGMGGMAGAGGMGGMAGAGGMGGMAGAGGMGGMAGAGGMGGMAGAGGTGGMPPMESRCLDFLPAAQGIDGEYLIDVDGSGPIAPLTVYCDMTTHGGGWTQLYDQDVTVLGGYLPTTTWAGGVTNTAPNFGQYSILQLTSDFVRDAEFELLIDWDDRTDFVQWTQTEDPFVGRGTLTTIINDSPPNQRGCTAFSGLAADGDGSQTLDVYSTLDGSSDTCWWWAIGTTGAFFDGIPAYDNSTGIARLVATRTRLWVR